jgi:hypothetical protein
MKKILITGLVVIGVITIVVAVNNVRINTSNPSFLVSLSDVESLTLEVCLAHPDMNIGKCRKIAGSVNAACVTPQGSEGRDCYGTTTVAAD